ncbi:MAG: PfkB family carbohydrate kinase [Pseudomonadota bacterium]
MNKSPHKGVLCVGRLYCDLIFTGVPRLPSYGTEVFAEGFGVHAGGGAVITAAHLSALGRRTALAAMLPSAPFADLVMPELRAAGLDLSLCRPNPTGAPQVTVAMAGAGDRAFLTRRTGPPFPEITRADLAGVGHIHIGELGTLIERPGILRLAQEWGATVSLDCAWDEGVTARDAAPLIAEVDVFLPNEAEAARLREQGLQPPFAPLTVTKRGAAGASAEARGGAVTVPAEPVEAVDTTGAGDAFNAGFLAAWLEGQGLEACLGAGNARGALAVTGRGGFRAEAQPELVK